MQIVINIPKDVIESAKSSSNYYPAYHFEKIWRAIANGTPLKEHGRLIDEKDLSLMTVHLIDGILVCDAPTIIEADTVERTDT